MPKVTFKKNRLLKEDMTLEGESGESILHVAQEVGVPLGSNCGGVCGCSTCHIYVLQNEESLSELSDKEEDRLDLGFDVKMNSRLGCQACLSNQDVVVDITEESLRAYLDENPDVRKHYQATGELLMVPHHHH